MTKKKRIDYLDMAKGIGILLVIIGHIPYISETLRQYIVSFHMPLFFIVSGMLIWHKKEEEESMGQFVARKCHSILFPYALFSVCVLFIELARILIKGTGEWGRFFRLLFQSICLQGVSVLWFFPALFIAEVVFLWLRKHSSHLVTLICIPVMLAVLFLIIAKVHVYFFARTDNIWLCLLFDIISTLLRGLFCSGLVGIGYYIGIVLFRWRLPVVAETAISVLAFVGVAFVAKWNLSVDLRYMFLGRFILFILGGGLGSLGVILFCRVLSQLPLKPLHLAMRYFGVNSMVIMVTHLDFRVMNISIKISELVNKSINNNVIFCTVIVLLICGMEILIIELVKYFMPKIVKQNRKIS